MTPQTLPLDQYEYQLTEKANRLRQMMLAFQAPEAQIFRSRPAHYRMRAEFRIWHDEDDLYHIMFDQQTKARIRIDHFMAGSALINTLMTEMMTAIRPEPVLRAKLFQIDYLTTLTATHRIERLALFDHFPYTHHMECGVLLVRKVMQASVIFIAVRLRPAQHFQPPANP